MWIWYGKFYFDMFLCMYAYVCLSYFSDVLQQPNYWSKTDCSTLLQQKCTKMKYFPTYIDVCIFFQHFVLGGKKCLEHDTIFSLFWSQFGLTWAWKWRNVWNNAEFLSSAIQGERDHVRSEQTQTGIIINCNFSYFSEMFLLRAKYLYLWFCFSLSTLILVFCVN